MFVSIEYNLNINKSSTEVWGKKGLVNFSTGKNLLVSFDRSNIPGALMKNGWVGPC